MINKGKYFAEHLPVFAWLIFGFCISALLSALLYLFLITQSYSDSKTTSNIYQQSIAASISQYEYLPALMASESLFINALLYASDNRLAVNQRLEFIATRAGADVAYIMNRSGQVIATSNYEQASSFLDKNYAFRPYFKEALASGERQFYYAQGATTGIPGFFIAEPISYNQQAIGVAVVKLSMSYWEENWKNADNTIIASDANGIIILSSNNSWRYKTIKPLTQQALLAINQLQQFGQRKHKKLYDEEHHLSFGFLSAIFPNMTFWAIDGNWYTVKKSLIPAVNWSLHHLVNHRIFLYPALILFSIFTVFILLAYLFSRERKHRMASIDKTKALETLRKEELKRVMDNINVGIILLTHEGKVVSLNTHAKLLLFKSYESPAQDINIEDVIDIRFDTIESLLFTDIASATYHETHTKSHTNEQTAIMFATSKIEAMNTTLYLMTFINIERRKAAENELLNINNSLEDIITQRTHELKEAQATLIQKNKATALGNMAATIVHELSQPLSAINSSVSAIDTKIIRGDWNGARASAARLNPLSKKMHNIINLLKNFSYNDEQSREKVDVDMAVRQSVGTFTDILADKKISLIKNYTPQRLCAFVNPLKLDLVITNILKNAIEAAENNNQPRITIHTEKKDSLILIHITDNGGGINNMSIPTLFTPYFTTKEVGKGLGLGLSISHEIIQEYQGNIRVENSNGGVCFSIEIPSYTIAQNTDLTN